MSRSRSSSNRRRRAVRYRSKDGRAHFVQAPHERPEPTIRDWAPFLVDREPEPENADDDWPDEDHPRP
jgi:hypothetical protein